MKTIIHWFLSAVAVAVAAYLLPGIAVGSFFAALVVAVVLGFLNAFVRPFLIILTLPVNLFTLGLFTFVINALIVLLTSAVVPGFSVANFWWALLFSLVLAAVNWMLHRLEKEE